MAQPVSLLTAIRPAARRAEGAPVFGDIAFALHGEPAGNYDEAWRPAKSLVYVFATCAALWVGAALAYVTLH